MPRFVLRVVLLFALVISARSVLADHYHVPTGSMEPTVQVGDRIVVNKAAYGIRLPLADVYLVEFEGPARGDVVVLASPEDGETLLKRVVAVPGDRVEVRGGRLVLNGQLAPVERDDLTGVSFERLDAERHSLSLEAGGGPELRSVVVPEGRFLVMGDNRGMSHDGRAFGWVERSAIRGKAVGVFHGEQGFTWRSL